MRLIRAGDMILDITGVNRQNRQQALKNGNCGSTAVEAIGKHNILALQGQFRCSPRRHSNCGR